MKIKNIPLKCASPTVAKLDNVRDIVPDFARQVRPEFVKNNWVWQKSVRSSPYVPTEADIAIKVMELVERERREPSRQGNGWASGRIRLVRGDGVYFLALEDWSKE